VLKNSVKFKYYFSTANWNLGSFGLYYHTSGSTGAVGVPKIFGPQGSCPFCELNKMAMGRIICHDAK
jgi:hypothetical protein